ncbi:hypothetical protein HOH87_03240 [bacterium]|jgi:hypothetical protein|nr:hypothetical protein [bacterium]
MTIQPFSPPAGQVSSFNVATGNLRGPVSTSQGISNRVLAPHQQRGQIREFLTELSKVSKASRGRKNPLHDLLGLMRRKEVPEIKAALTQPNWIMGQDRSPLGKVVDMFDDYAAKGTFPSRVDSQLVKDAMHSAAKVLDGLQEAAFNTYMGIDEVVSSGRALKTASRIESTILWSYFPNEYIYHFEVKENTAVLAQYEGRSSSLTLVDVSDKANPKAVSKFLVAKDIEKIEISANRVCFVEDTRPDETLRTIDISDSDNPRMLGDLNMDTSWLTPLKVVGDFAFLENGEGNLVKINIDKAQPSIDSELSIDYLSSMI